MEVRPNTPTSVDIQLPKENQSDFSPTGPSIRASEPYNLRMNPDSNAPILRPTIKPVKRFQESIRYDADVEKEKDETDDDLKKRKETLVWSMEEKDAFFEAVKEHGKNFPMIQKYIASKMKKLPFPGFSKMKKARFLYYRTWSMISRCQHVDLDKNVPQIVKELFSIINYGELRKYLTIKSLDQVNGRRLNQLINHGQVTIRSRQKNLRVKTPICQALRKLMKSREDTDIYIALPSTLQVNFHPADNCTLSCVREMAQNPKVHFNVAPSKTLDVVIDFLLNKWQLSSPLRSDMQEVTVKHDEQHQVLLCPVECISTRKNSSYVVGLSNYTKTYGTACLLHKKHAYHRALGCRSGGGVSKLSPDDQFSSKFGHDDIVYRSCPDDVNGDDIYSIDKGERKILIDDEAGDKIVRNNCDYLLNLDDVKQTSQSNDVERVHDIDDAEPAEAIDLEADIVHDDKRDTSMEWMEDNQLGLDEMAQGANNGWAVGGMDDDCRNESTNRSSCSDDEDSVHDHDKADGSHLQDFHEKMSMDIGDSNATPVSGHSGNVSKLSVTSREQTEMQRECLVQTSLGQCNKSRTVYMMSSFVSQTVIELRRTVESTKEQLEVLNHGWTKESSTNLTLAELYVMAGAPSILLMEYALKPGHEGSTISDLGFHWLAKLCKVRLSECQSSKQENCILKQAALKVEEGSTDDGVFIKPLPFVRPQQKPKSRQVTSNQPRPGVYHSDSNVIQQFELYRNRKQSRQFQIRRPQKQIMPRVLPGTVVLSPAKMVSSHVVQKHLMSGDEVARSGDDVRQPTTITINLNDLAEGDPSMKGLQIEDFLSFAMKAHGIDKMSPSKSQQLDDSPDSCSEASMLSFEMPGFLRAEDGVTNYAAGSRGDTFSRNAPDVDAQIRVMLDENSLDFISKFEDFARKLNEGIEPDANG